jgi:hypothetical protein
MQYYLMGPSDTEQDALNEANLLGEASFKHFWGGSGLKTLMRLVDKDPEMLEHFIVINEKGKRLTISEFLQDIQKLKVLIR